MTIKADRTQFLATPMKLLLKDIKPDELELVRIIFQNGMDEETILPALFDFAVEEGKQTEVLKSFVLYETKTQKILKVVEGEERDKWKEKASQARKKAKA